MLWGIFFRNNGLILCCTNPARSTRRALWMTSVSESPLDFFAKGHSVEDAAFSETGLFSSVSSASDTSPAIRELKFVVGVSLMRASIMSCSKSERPNCEDGGISKPANRIQLGSFGRRSFCIPFEISDSLQDSVSSVSLLVCTVPGALLGRLLRNYSRGR